MIAKSLIILVVIHSAASLEGLFSTRSATVKIVPGTVGPSGTPVEGLLSITQFSSGVHITGTITGLEPGLHGFHVHEKGLLTNECKDAGGHFNPLERKHGDPRDYHRHIGDLGNIKADSLGIATVSITDVHASLNPMSNSYIGGLAIVVHAGEDDLGLAGNDGSLSTGNAGARRACGIIEVLEPPPFKLLKFKGNNEGSYYYPTPSKPIPLHFQPIIPVQGYERPPRYY